jgi:hypothetical protein
MTAPSGEYAAISWNPRASAVHTGAPVATSHSATALVPTVTMRRPSGANWEVKKSELPARRPVSSRCSAPDAV